MAFSGGGKPFSPFTVNTSQAAQNQPPTAVASFTFGANAASGAPPSGAFNFGGGGPAQSVASAPQLSFTAPTPAAASAPLFNFGSAANPAPAAAAPVASAAPSFSIGGGAPPAFGAVPSFAGVAASPSVSAPSLATAAPAATSAGGGLGLGFSFGGSQPQPAASVSTPSLSGFGAPTTQQAGGGGGFSFGQPAVAATTPATTSAATTAPFNLASTSTTASVPPTFGLSTSTPAASTAAGSLNLSAAIPATSVPASTGFSFGGSATGAPALNVPNPLKLTTTTATGSLSAPTTGVSTTSAAPVPGTSTGAQLSSSTATTQSSATNVTQMNFRQLQEAINKWMIDLQEQEKLFIEQATRVNACDRTLIANGDKIAKLNDHLSKVKGDHTRLEHALDYLKTQQKEIEAFLEPLEAGLPLNMPVEPEREQLYTLTETVDTQLQQMAEDLKEVIRHVNESNKMVDKSDPISQILRILNEHMDALHWVEDNTNQVKQALDDVAKQHQQAKKEHERSLRNMYK